MTGTEFEEFARLANGSRSDRRKARRIAVRRQTLALSDAEREVWAIRAEAVRRGYRFKTVKTRVDILAGDELALEETRRDVQADPGVVQALREFDQESR